MLGAFCRRAVGSLCENMSVSTKPEVVTYRNAVREGHRFGEVRLRGFRDMRADRHANRQTNGQKDILITIPVSAQC